MGETVYKHQKAKVNKYDNGLAIRRIIGYLRSSMKYRIRFAGQFRSEGTIRFKRDILQFETLKIL
jgi:hypothetical protein